jgi:GTPase Era involved in 16S rRNA processing
VEVPRPAAAAAPVPEPVSSNPGDTSLGGSVASGDGRRENLLQSIRDQVRIIYERIDPLHQKFRFKSRPTTAEIFSKPLVVFLGNHSSGKSTFVNYILKTSSPSFQDVQKTGVAPLDDGFTFISYGKHMDEQQGPAIVSNANLPFNSLSKFGPQFVNHLRLKLCPVPLLNDVILVDSPGMIDSATEGADRGYDFIKAVRWFSERADYVCVFFDPDKPGTTGESLEVFTKALNGIDHKLLIIFNKVDRFDSVSDFSRAYGALCWNLAKVIPYKDIPYVYTTYVPVERAAPVLNWSLDEFAKSRDEVINKITHAPSRHMDNMITELRKYAEQLLVHAKVISSARNQLWWYRLRIWLTLLLVVGACFGAAWHYQRHALDHIALFALPLVALVIFGFLNLQLVAWREKVIVSELHSHFEKAHEMELLSRDQKEELERLWEGIQSTTLSTIQRFGLLSFPSIRKAEVATLDEIVQKRTTQLLTTVHNNLIKRPQTSSSS